MANLDAHAGRIERSTKVAIAFAGTCLVACAVATAVRLVGSPSLDLASIDVPPELLSAIAAGGRTAGNTFLPLQTLVDAAGGWFGRALALAAVMLGVIVGMVRGSLAPAVAAFAFAIMVSIMPGVLSAIVEDVPGTPTHAATASTIRSQDPARIARTLASVNGVQAAKDYVLAQVAVKKMQADRSSAGTLQSQSDLPESVVALIEALPRALSGAERVTFETSRLYALEHAAFGEARSDMTRAYAEEANAKAARWRAVAALFWWLVCAGAAASLALYGLRSVIVRRLGRIKNLFGKTPAKVDPSARAGHDVADKVLAHLAARQASRRASTGGSEWSPVRASPDCPAPGQGGRTS